MPRYRLPVDAVALPFAALALVYLRTVLRSTLRRARRVITVSRASRRDLVRLFAADPDRLVGDQRPGEDPQRLAADIELEGGVQRPLLRLGGPDPLGGGYGLRRYRFFLNHRGPRLGGRRGADAAGEGGQHRQGDHCSQQRLTRAHVQPPLPSTPG